MHVAASRMHMLFRTCRLISVLLCCRTETGGHDVLWHELGPEHGGQCCWAPRMRSLAYQSPSLVGTRSALPVAGHHLLAWNMLLQFADCNAI